MATALSRSYSLSKILVVLGVSLGVFLQKAAADSLSDKVQWVVDDTAPVQMLKALVPQPGQEEVRSVDVLAFSFAIDKLNAQGQREVDLTLQSTKIAQRLIELKNSGVPVRVILDTFNADVADENKFTEQILRQGGVEVQDKATHANGMLINKNKLILGSTNLTQQSLTQNNETNLIMTEPGMLAAYFAYYECRWSHTDAANVDAGVPCRASVVDPSSTPQWKFVTDTFFKDELLRMVNAATTSIEFSISAFNDIEADDAKNLEKALIRVATDPSRHVEIRALFNQKVNALNNTGPALLADNKQVIADLQAAGVKIAALAEDTEYTHSAFLVRDRQEVLIGSGNWTDQDFNHYPQVYFLINETLSVGQPESFIAQQISRHLWQKFAYDVPREKKQYHRFWIGYKNPAIPTLSAFDTDINTLFVKDTVRTGGGHGLNSYMPVLPLMAAAPITQTVLLYGNTFQMPDEYALVSYSDDWTYRAIRETEVGREYGPLHADYFSVDFQRGIETNVANNVNSGSLVPMDFAGTLAINQAYDLTPKANWLQTSHTRLTPIKTDVADPELYRQNLEVFLKKMQGQLQANTSPLSAYVVAVLPAFVVEYYQIAPGQDESAAEILGDSGERVSVLEQSLAEDHVLQKASPSNPGLSRDAEGTPGITADFDPTVGPAQIKLIMSESETSLLNSQSQQEQVQIQIRKELRGQN